MSKTSRWKNNEHKAAEVMQKYKIPATRKTRGDNFAISDFDVGIDGHPEVIIDAKYTQRGWVTNRLVDETRAKYAKAKTDPVLIWTKGFRERGEKCCMDGEFAAMLLSYWLGYGTKEELFRIWEDGR